MRRIITVGFLFIFVLSTAGLAIAAKVKSDPKREQVMLAALDLAEAEAKAKIEEGQSSVEPKKPEPKVTIPPEYQKKEETPAPEKGKVKEAEPESKKDTVPEIEKGAWTLKKGQVYLESYNKFYWHYAHFTSRNQKEKWSREGRYKEIRTELKFEYGLTDKLTGLLSVPYKWAHWNEEKDEDDFYTHGWQDMWLGAKYNILKKPVVTSLQLRVKIPLGYGRNATPSLGDGQIDTDLKVLLGSSLRPLPAYAKLEFGYRARDKFPEDQVPYFFELGYNLTDNLLFKTSIDGVETAHIGGIQEECYTKGVVSLVYKIRKGWNVEAGYGETFAGKNSSAGKEIIFSTVVQF